MVIINFMIICLNVVLDNFYEFVFVWLRLFVKEFKSVIVVKYKVCMVKSCESDSK